MADKITVTSRTSYGNRVKNSVKKIFTGVLLLLGSIILLIRNERNFVREKSALNEGSKITIEVESTNIDSQNNGKLVYFYGNVTSPVENLTDPQFGINTTNLKLKRNVEMYQWKENTETTTKDEFGGAETETTTYSYTKTWNNSPINSENFYNAIEHKNPTHREYENAIWEKDPILVGDFTLSDTFADKLSNYKDLSLLDIDIKIPGKYKNLSTIQNKSDGTVSTNDIEDKEISTETSDNVEKQLKFHVLPNMIYIGSNPQNPEVGDLKITFATVKVDSASIVGQQNENGITSYKTSNGKNISLLEVGQVNKDTMFANAHASNKIMTWALRLLGLFLMFTAFSMIFDIIVTLAKVIPFLSTILGMGTSLMAFILTLVVGFFTIAIAWLVVRPLVGITLLLVGIGGAILVVKLKKKSKNTNNTNNKDLNNDKTTNDKIISNDTEPKENK